MTLAHGRRLQLRAAIKIYEKVSETASRRVPALPLDEWRRLFVATGGVTLAVERGWKAAEEVARREQRRLLAQLSERLTHWGQESNREDRLREVQSPREIFTDIVALESEFDDVSIDFKAETLSVTTDTIVLEGVRLGRFRIVLHWEGLPGVWDYDVVALDPNPAASDSSKTHPHVSDDELCEGDGRMPLARAIADGRLLDFFVLVRQILETYNPGSAYVPLSRWNGQPCSDCGYTGDEDDITNCDCCSSDVCFDCHASCSDCGRGCCSDCRERCHDCDESFCPSCLACCSTCESSVCRNCRKDGRCETCQHTDEETDELEHDPTHEIETAQIRAKPEPAGSPV